jgi:uncharacterized protein (TIGR03086 family)
MSEIIPRYARVAAGFTARVRGCPSERWSSPSPCEGWTARDVAKHVIDVHRRAGAAITGGNAVELASGDDVGTAWSAATDTVGRALADPALASKPLGGRFGEQPFEQLVSRLLCSDVLVHTWDLARATGQDDRLDPDAARIAYDNLQSFEAQLRAPGGFGPALNPPPDADDQTRLLCFVGRRP